MNFIALILIISFLFQEQDRVRIFMIGDSTMCNWSEKYYPETGWGQVFHEFFTDQVEIRNHARSGKSSKSFRTQGFWAPVLSEIRPGDFVIIQFGHNDSKKDTVHFAEPHSAYKRNLINYISEIRRKGANPVLCTSIVRRRFDDHGQFFDTLGEYPGVVRSVSREHSVPLIDLHHATRELVELAGSEKSTAFFLHTLPGEFSSWPNGKTDNTHLNRNGARKVAEMAAKALREQHHQLANFLK